MISQQPILHVYRKQIGTENHLFGRDIEGFNLKAIQSIQADTEDFYQYKVVYFTAHEGFDVKLVGDKMANWVSAGGRLIVCGFLHHSNYRTLSGRFTNMFPIQRGRDIQTVRTIGCIHDNEFAEIADGLDGKTIDTWHMQGADLNSTPLENDAIRIIDTTDNLPLLAVNRIGEGLVFQINSVACSNRNHGYTDPIATKLVQNTLRFASNFANEKVQKKEVKLTYTLQDLSKVRRIKVTLGDLFVLTEDIIARQCGDLLKNLIEGDIEADTYPLNLPDMKCAHLIAFYVRNGNISVNQLEVENFTSFLLCADYLQSDDLFQVAQRFFGNLEKARQISLQDEDFGFDKVSYVLLQKLMPQLNHFHPNDGSPWRDIVRNWLRKSENKSVHVPVDFILKFV